MRKLGAAAFVSYFAVSILGTVSCLSFCHAAHAKPPVRQLPGNQAMPVDRLPDSINKSLAHLLRLRSADDRYSVRAFFDDHPELHNNSRALAESALNYAAIGWVNDSIQLIERAEKLSPRDDYVLASKAWILYKAKKASAGLRPATEAVKSKPSARNLAILSEVFRGMGDDAKAEEALSKAADVDADSIDVVGAKIRMSRGRFKGSAGVKYATDFLKKHPKDLRALILRSEVWELLGKNKDAIADLSTVLALKPDHLYAYQKRAERYQKERDFKAAVKDVRKLQTFKLDPSAMVIANGTLAECLESLGDLKGALEARKRNYVLERKISSFDLMRGDVKQLNSGFARDSIEYCRLEIALKQYGTALPKLNSILVAYPNNTQARELRARALEGLSRWNEALTDWDRLINKHSSFPKWYESRAAVYQKLGKADAARSDLETARKLSQDP